MARTVTVGDLATFVTSKNAGPFLLTMDIVFKDDATYRRVKEMGVISADSMAALYAIPLGDVVKVTHFDPASAIKVTIKRPIGSGAVGETDVYGAQQHVPIMQFEVRWDE